jgi:N-acetyl-gamma-glutamyl-phosphate reductase
MQPNDTITASIIGITGYTGLEILRLLKAHPNVKIGHLTSRQHDGKSIGEIYPHLAHLNYDVTNTDHNDVAAASDVVFLALPHKTAQNVVADMHGKTKVIDLSADYRLDDIETYQRYYTDHAHPDLLNEVVYGAPEFFKDQIANASTVANPGCFALLSQFLLYPFAVDIASADIIAVTGSSGAGKSPVDGTHHPVRNHNLKSYGINKHRHIPEIIRTAQIDETQLNFVPTSGPFTRGIFAQAFVTLKDGAPPPLKNDVQNMLHSTYKDAPFIRVQNEVALANIVGSNYVDLSAQIGQDGRILVQGALDNLVKGAAGCAVQNMNIMMGLNETTGLSTLGAVYP